MPVDEVSEAVWATVGLGRKRRMTKCQAEALDYPFEVITEEGTASNNGSTVYGRTPFLHKEELEKIKMQTGVEIRDRDDLERYHKTNGTHSMERGERGDVHRRAIADWVESGSRGPAPVPVRPEHDFKSEWSMDRCHEEVRRTGRRPSRD